MGKNICNSIIHSYVYCLFLDEKTNIGGFFVSSDFDRNKLLYQVNLNSWIDFLEYIVDDDVAATTFHFNKGKKEYVSRRKVKGSDHKYSRINYIGSRFTVDCTTGAPNGL